MSKGNGFTNKEILIRMENKQDKMDVKIDIIKERSIRTEQKLVDHIKETRDHNGYKNSYEMVKETIKSFIRKRVFGIN